MRIYIQLIVFLLYLSYASYAQEKSYDFPALVSKMQEVIWSDSDGGAASWVSQQNSDGSWSDLSYTSKTNVTNSKNHMIRLYDIAQCCTDSTKEHYNDVDYVNALKLGLQYWYNHKATDSNWWYNKIYYPQKLGEVMLMMRNLEDTLPRSSTTELSEDDLITLFSPTANSGIFYNGTGANAVDITLHYIYRGVLTEDASVIEGAINTLEPTLAENIVADLVYQDHGPQLQVSSYAYVFCNGLIELAYYLSETPAAFDTQSSNFATVLNFIREVQIPAIRGQYWDFSVLGRSISRPNCTKAGLGYLETLSTTIDTVNVDYYNKALDRIGGTEAADYNVKEFHSHYWESDYTQHAKSDYLFTVRCVSTRTVECEEGNNENIKGNYLSYGATFIAVDGDEYYNIMPVWDWSMIPGTTVKHTTTFANRTDWGFNYGSTSFVGGVSDGNYGATVLDQDNDGVEAQKSWFFFDDEVVCLGAGITGSSVRTTINQCLFEGTVSYVTSDSETVQTQSVSSSEQSKTNLKWLRHGKVTYYLPEESNVKFTLKSQSGSWYDINKGYSSDEISKYVFNMWVDHGTCTNDNYAYIVAPNVTTDDASKAYDVSKIQIIQNDDDVQAVYHKELGLLEAIFYTADTIVYNGRTLAVNEPCAVIMDDNKLTISDPKQLLSIIKVDLTANGQTYTKYVSMPTGDEKGSSTQVRFRITSGVESPTSNSLVTIYPNPVTSSLNIELCGGGVADYKVLDVNGKTVLSGSIENDKQISVNHLSGGIYFIQVNEQSKGMSFLSFVKL